MFRNRRNSVKNYANNRSRRTQRRRLVDGLQSLEKRQLLAADVLLADSFEAGQWAGNWVEDGQNDWFTSSQRSTDGSYSAEIDGWASNATLTTNSPIDLSGYSSAELTFDWLIERGFDRGEYLSLDISTNGGASWQTDVRRLSGNVDAENTWHSETVDLSSYTTSQLLIRFRSKVSRSNEDANVDNVKITAVPQSPAFPPSIEYADFSDASDLTLVADTTASPERLRLTTATLDVGGAAWHHDKQFVSIGFETTFQFQMSEGNDGENGGGAGFAFVIQNNPAPVAKASHLGYHQVANNLAIEFDTVQESSLNDPSDSHVSVHSRGRARNHWNEDYSLGSFNTSGFKLDNGDVHTAKVTYTPGTMEIYLNDLTTPQLVIPLDLEDLLDLDHGRATVGFTASAGGGSQNHDILSWTFANTEDTSSTLTIVDSSVIEGDSGSADLDFTLQRLGDMSASATVAWSTAADTATAGADYATSQGQVVFSPGEIEKTISVPVFGDLEEETNEVFRVKIQVTDGPLTVVDGSAVGSILNDDVSISVADDAVTEGDHQFGFIDSAVDTTAVSINATRKAIIRPDGYLYLNSEVPPEILRYDADTGVFIDRFAAMPNSEQATFRDFNFGPDDDLYVIDRKPGYRVLRFDGTSGAYKSEFVASRSGGLDSPKAFVFGDDGNLYVTSHGDKVLKYQGPFGTEPGAFLGEFVSGSGRPDTPDNLTFGPNGDLFVGYSNTVDRYNGTTGSSLGTFVQPGSGGLSRLFQGGLIFGPDRNGDAEQDLYVSSGNTDQVLVYDGIDGSFVEPLFSPGLGGLDLPAGLTFDDDGNLLVGKVGGDDDMLRYGIQSQAIFTVSLSKPSGVPVTVQFTTADGTAQSGDYTPVSGTLTFPPGVTSRTIIVPTVDDAVFESTETFRMVLSNPVAASIADGTGVGTITDDDPMPVNNLPVADDDAYAIAEDGVLNVPTPGVLDGDTDADNDPLTASLVSQALNGVVVLEADGSFTYTPEANFNGSDSFSYTAFDGIGNSNVATVSLTVTAVNDAPVADEQNVSTKVNTPQGMTLSGSDIEGDSLWFSVLAGPTSGILSGTMPNLVYSPDNGFVGSDSFTFIASDGAANSAPATITINVLANNAPVADPQEVTVDEDGSIGVLLTGSDPDSDSITFQIVDLPLHGSLTGTVPNLSYSPVADYNGEDSFTFLVNDGTDDSVTATVTLTVNPVNDAPTADAQSVGTAEDTPLALTLSGNDIDGDSVGYIVVAGPANGTLVGSGANRTYTPTADFNGSDSFTFKVNDGQVDSAVATVSIDVTAVNDAPVATADSYSLDQDTTLSVDAPGVLGNDSDVDGDSITAVLVTTTNNGLLTLLGDGSFDYTPNPGFVGSDSFSYQADDSLVRSNTVIVTLTVNAVSVGPNLSHGEVTSVADSWQTVTLPTTYTSMVVIATPRYNSGSGPGVARIRNASGSSFQVRIDSAGSSAFSGGVHYVVVEEGVYDEAGFKLEAVKYSEDQTSRKNGWVIDTVGYQQSYSSPVVVGQVMTANDEDWSVFWASSGSRTSPPSASQLNVGKHVGEDPDTTRASETIGYLVIEATQNGTIEGLPFVAGVGSDIVRGVGNGSYTYNYTAMPNSKTAVLSSAGMDGGDGGWAVLNGSNPLPPSGGTIDLVIDEDQQRDSERKHTTEQVAYFVIDPPVAGKNSVASVPSPLQGSTLHNPYDVNGDGYASPLDVLLIVNRLNSAQDSEKDDLAIDTNGDGTLSAIGVLLVINHLNAEKEGSTSTLQAEAEMAIDMLLASNDDDELYIDTLMETLILDTEPKA